MEQLTPPPSIPFGPDLDFTPVPQGRTRHDGWSPETQQRFIKALEAMGAVGPAARAVGMGRASAYRLRERPGAESFARAWDQAIERGRWRAFEYAMDHAINGVTTIRVLKGGSMTVSAGPDMRLVQAALREAPGPSPKATKETV